MKAPTARSRRSQFRDDPAHARTFLFVPASTPHRFETAWASAADVVVIDLEDAVGSADKITAREAVRRANPHARRLVVRINPPGTPWYDGDLSALAGRAVTVVLPKAEDTGRVAELRAILGPGCDVIPLIETAAGWRSSWELAAEPGTVRLALGHLDLAVGLGIDPDHRAALLSVRSALVGASAAAGIDGPVDGVTTALRDPERVRDDAAYAANLGFSGKLLIHPDQVDPALAGLSPSPELIAWAVALVDRHGDGGVAVEDSHMVDAPVLARARRILAQQEKQ